jgi:hypothetical protein
MRNVVSAMAVVSIVPALVAAPRYANINVVLRPEMALQPVYDAMPSRGAYFVAYEGESLGLIVEIGNPTTEPQTLITGGSLPAQDLNVSATRDGQPEALQITVSPEVHQSGPGVDLPGLWPNRLSLMPRRKLEVAATLNRPLRPGRYEFQLETTLKDEDGRSVNPLGVTLPIEVRGLSADTQTEIQYRRAAFAYVRRDYAEAERQIARLEAQSPNSFSVPVIRGNIALAQGRRPEAVALFDRALQILQSGADVEYARRVDAVRLQRTIGGLVGSRDQAAR